MFYKVENQENISATKKTDKDFVTNKKVIIKNNLSQLNLPFFFSGDSLK